HDYRPAKPPYPFSWTSPAVREGVIGDVALKVSFSIVAPLLQWITRSVAARIVRHRVANSVPDEPANGVWFCS
ncbi:hypothetical protein, partial [Brevundimonas sp.]|uniref:hypothetical protein n=1 Tax=Brevundimonas sp. TaxID=1871086 RepID=UPI00272FD391